MDYHRAARERNSVKVIFRWSRTGTNKKADEVSVVVSGKTNCVLLPTPEDQVLNEELVLEITRQDTKATEKMRVVEQALWELGIEVTTLIEVDRPKKK